MKSKFPKMSATSALHTLVFSSVYETRKFLQPLVFPDRVQELAHILIRMFDDHVFRGKLWDHIKVGSKEYSKGSPLASMEKYRNFGIFKKMVHIKIAWRGIGSPSCLAHLLIHVRPKLLIFATLV